MLFNRTNISSLTISILIAGMFFSCKSTHLTMSNSTQNFAVRLLPEWDLKKSIDSIVKLNNIEAGWITACVGSLKQYSIRFANMPEHTTGNGHYEIVSLSGTLSTAGSHLHISVSDSTGKTIGGHLTEGCIIYTTAEIIITKTNNYKFSRVKDGTTPWNELKIDKN